MTAGADRPVVTPQGAYWARARRFTAIMFLVWLTTTLGVVYFARELAGVTVLGWPLSYYMAAQGTTLIHVAIVALYAWRMHRLDRRYRREVQDAG